ncbi:MAG: EamA family transporter [Natronomonas sp.]
MQYILYAILALVSYSVVAPLFRLATQELPADTVAVVTNGMLVGTLLVVIAVSDKPLGSAFTHEHAPYMYAAGVFLTIGIIAYYRALAVGPVSVVVPIFGLFIAVSSALGIAFLDEPLTTRKTVGIGLALAAVYLTAFE